jgi:hypothetical protein
MELITCAYCKLQYFILVKREGVIEVLTKSMLFKCTCPYCDKDTFISVGRTDFAFARPKDSKFAGAE